jgi:phosphoglycerate dehydrogenase-like enzyme
MSNETPAIILAHYPGAELLTPADHERLGSVGRIIDAMPIGDWTDPRADGLLAEADVIVGHWGCPPIDASVLERAPRLGLVAYAAGTVKGVVTPDVFGRGVRVTSGAAANAEPVAEFTLATILFAGKDVLWRRVGARVRPPSDKGPAVVVGNYGRTIGIIGASLIGRRVIELLRQFPELHVVLYDPFATAAEAALLGVEKAELDQLCSMVDVLSIHAPDLPATRKMIGAGQLAALPTGATVINTARGALLDHDALVAELSSGRLKAVLDVTDPEPLPDDHPLRTLPNCWLAPHLAGSQGNELTRLIDRAAQEIERWRVGEPAINEVLLSQLDRLA